MKFLDKYVVLAFVLSFVISCTPDNTLERMHDADKRECILNCAMERVDDVSKVGLSLDHSTVVWQQGDQLSVLSESGEKTTFYLQSGAGSSNARFSGEIEGSSPYTAFYPASNDVTVTEDFLSFHLTETQNYVQNSFGIGASPMVAQLEDLASPIQFKNLCGLLCLKFTTKPSKAVSKVVVRDLAGNLLWGDCRLKLDGKEGTANQTMTISGGSNRIVLSMSSPVFISESEPTRFYFVVPPGSFDNGFAVTLYDTAGNSFASFQTNNQDVVIQRSSISNMSCVNMRIEHEDVNKRGYYKDLFEDSGIRLTSNKDLPAFSFIGWDYEYFVTPSNSSNTQEDANLQKMFFTSAEDDENGYLLYPDRQPRFRCIYVNGGNSYVHGPSLGASGQQTIRDFFNNGGSYIGSCAGAFLACANRDYSPTDKIGYIRIFPGMMISSNKGPLYTDMRFQEGCPLRNYYDFEDVVKNVYHNTGGYMSEAAAYVPEGTEILLRYINCPPEMPALENKVACWAYKPTDNKQTGRMVIIGSHPERMTAGEDNLKLFAAMLRYASDGHGIPPIKATLAKGEPYACSSKSSENNPAHARIGDKQYHHFKLEIPEGVGFVTLKLESEFVDDDLYLSLRKDDYAWFSEADYTLTSDGSNKTLKIRALEPGTYYVSVYAPNTVTAAPIIYASTGSYYKYTGKTHLLNGIPYTLTADWKIRNDKDGGNENFKGQDDLGDDFEFEFD